MRLVNKTLMLSLMLVCSIASAAEIVVFYPTTYSPLEIKNVFNKKIDKVKVFARSRDFISYLKISKPELILTHGQFASDSKAQYRNVFQMEVEGSQFFKYMLLSLKKKEDASISKSRIGLVGFSNKKNIQSYFMNLFNAPLDMKGLKVVAKPNNLFPLLVFGSVDYIMISPQNYKIIKKQFKTKIYTIKESKPVPYPSIFIRADLKDDTFKMLKEISGKDLESIGFSGIK